MKSIWKYTLALLDVQYVSLPANAQILSAQVQHGEVCLSVGTGRRACKRMRDTPDSNGGHRHA